MPRRSEIQPQPFRAVYSVFIIPEYASKPDWPAVPVCPASTGGPPAVL